MALLSSATPGRHYAGYKLRHILSLTVLDRGEGYRADHYRRQIEFLNCLLNARDERLVYDLRLVSVPEPDAPWRGRVDLALLCAMRGMSSSESEARARDLLHLLEAFFDEYAFEPTAPDELQALLRPFPIRHLVGLTRRAGFQRLDTLGPTSKPRRLGFATAPADDRTRVDGTKVFHVHPFLPTFGSFTPLLRLLLLQSEPAAVSIRLGPTELRPEERAFLEEGIASCERAVQAHVGGEMPLDLSELRPALQEMARQYSHYQFTRLQSLEDNAGVVTVEIASPAPISAALVDALGTIVTEPAGGSRAHREHSPHAHLAGGYELVSHDDGSADACSHFETLDLTFSTHAELSHDVARLVHLFDTNEAATAFRLPPATLEPPPGLPLRTWRLHAAPRELPMAGCLLGKAGSGRATQAVRIAPEDRRRHMYVVGQTGTGKTTLLKTMILDDMRSGAGLAVIDPHGDLYHELLELVPASRVADVVLIDPTDVDHAVGINLLESTGETQQYFIAQEMVGIMSRLLSDEFGAHSVGNFAGPIFFQHMRMNLLLAMSNPDDPGTLLKFHQIFQEKDYWKRWLPLRTRDPLLERWTREVLPKMDYLRPGSEGSSMGSYMNSKFEPFIYDPRLRRIFAQERSTLDVRAAMDEGKILLVNLSKGELTEANARFMGMVIMAKIMAAGMARAGDAPSSRRVFYVYVDEFQSFATQSFATLLSEARKFGLSLVLANQYISQIDDPRILKSVLGNVGTIASFRTGLDDAERLEHEFLPGFNRYDLANLPNWCAYLTTLIDGRTIRPFSFETVLDAAAPDEARARQIVELSRRRYAKSRDEVDRELERGFARPAGSESQAVKT
jgi:hypothetical protein